MAEEKKKKKMGRPRKLPLDSTSVTAHLASSERELLEALVRERGTSLSEEARRAIVFYLQFGGVYEAEIERLLERANQS